MWRSIYVVLSVYISLSVSVSAESSGSGSGSGEPLFPPISAENNNTRCIPINTAREKGYILDICNQYFPQDKCFIFNFTTQFVSLRSSLDLLNNALSTAPATDFCKESVRAYVCNYVYPGCNPFTGLPQGTCIPECQFYLKECRGEFNTLIHVIETSEQFSIAFDQECINTVAFTGVNNDPSDCFNITDLLTEEPPSLTTVPRTTVTSTEPMTIPTGLSIPLIAGLTTAAFFMVVILLLILLTTGVLVFVWRKSRRKPTDSDLRQVHLVSPRRNSYFYDVSMEMEDHSYDCPEDALLFRFREEDVAAFDDNVQLQEALLPFQHLQMTEILGEGAFGRVFKGYYMKQLKDGNTDTIVVAIKTIKNTQGAYSELKHFIEESSLMCTFDHPHVLGMVGISLDSCQSPYLILPFMEHGDLRSFLRNKREMATKSMETGYPEGLEYELLVRICSEIASGMEYLASRKLVHRDLAARNCMVDSDLSVRVGDFGLARDIYQDDYYRQNSRIKIPVKWMAPESLHDGISNEKTDVWSYGVTCWEVFSLGRMPYPTIPNQDILEHLESGRRLKRPGLASDVVHDLMQDCWQHDPKKRPTFLEITRVFTTTIFPDTTQGVYSLLGEVSDDAERTSSTSSSQRKSSRVASTSSQRKLSKVACAAVEDLPLLDSIISHFENTPSDSFILENSGATNNFLESLKSETADNLKEFTGEYYTAMNPEGAESPHTLKSFRESLVLETPLKNGHANKSKHSKQNGHVASDYYTEINPQGALLSRTWNNHHSVDSAAPTAGLIFTNEYDEIETDSVNNREESRRRPSSPPENYIQMMPA